MEVTIICSSKIHPVYTVLKNWAKKNSSLHNIKLVSKSLDITQGDILFLVSCSELIPSEIRKRFNHTLVIHESDLPKGRGWSPLNWQILDGAKEITVSLLEAEDKVDSGDIWKQEKIKIESHEVFDEINAKLFPIKLGLIEYAIKHHNTIKPFSQSKEDPSYYKRRTPEDSKLDVDRTIAQQFDLLRIADNVRYPCFFNYKGHRFKLTLSKLQ